MIKALFDERWKKFFAGTFIMIWLTAIMAALNFNAAFIMAGIFTAGILCTATIFNTIN